MKEASYRALQAAAIHSLAVIAYCCLFGLISLLTKRILIVGILYAAFLEGLFANMPFSIRLATVIYYTRLIAYRSMGFVTATPGRSTGTTDIAADIWQLDVHADPGLLDHPQIRTCLIVLLGRQCGLRGAGGVLFSQREFHVKTPEKA